MLLILQNILRHGALITISFQTTLNDQPKRSGKNFSNIHLKKYLETLNVIVTKTIDYVDIAHIYVGYFSS